tara:strand:- start:285 stop:866 length:582 start_codon:yes stop_codon:yes gene_type:complete
MVLDYITDTFDYKPKVLELLKKDAYRKGEFTLSSGRKSEHYVNCKPVTLNGMGLTWLSCMILPHIDEDIVAVGGLTLGADPLVCGVAAVAFNASKARLNLDALIVRKEQKGYGANAWIEGKLPPEGSKVVVLEDVTTTGASAVKAVEKLRDAGYVVDRIITIVDRQVDGEADTNVLAAKCELISLFSLEELYT